MCIALPSQAKDILFTCECKVASGLYRSWRITLQVEYFHKSYLLENDVSL